MKFSDLVFEWRPGAINSQARHTFPNGYSVSIVQGPYTYGGDRGLYEGAIIRDGEIDYTTPITSDVVGYMDPDQVTEFLATVEALPCP